MSYLTLQQSAAQLLDPRRQSIFFDDFISEIQDVSMGNMSWAIQLTGDGTVAPYPAAGASAIDTTCFGVVGFAVDSLTVPSSATLSCFTDQAGSIGLLGAGSLFYETRIRVDALRTVADEYSIYAGIGEKTPDETEPTYGVFFRYSATSGFWQALAKNTAGTTTVTSSVTVAANTWYRLRAEINNAATSVSFYVNSTLIGTANANIPVAVGENISPILKLSKTATTGVLSSFLADYFLMQKLFNPTR